jgi:hypothetical protein
MSSWLWRKILLSRDWFRRKFVSSIVDETTTSLWLDYWLLDGQRLCDLMPFRVLTYTGLSWNIKVSDIIKRDTYAFPSGSLKLQPIWDSITFNP